MSRRYLFNSDLDENQKMIIFVENFVEKFGGLDNYVNDIFDKNTINKILEMKNDKSEAKFFSVIGMLKVINHIIKDPRLSIDNKRRLEDAAEKLKLVFSSTAPSAGGSKKTHRFSRKKLHKPNHRRKTLRRKSN